MLMKLKKKYNNINSRMDMKLRHLAGTLFIVLVLGMMIYLVITPNPSEGFVDAGRCGVDLPPCLGERVRCMNGYCSSVSPPSQPSSSGLPVI